MPDSGDPHRVHGMGTALEVPRWPAITADEAQGILARFPAAHDGTGRPVQLRWHSPRPFSAAVLAEAGGGEVLLKRHHRRVRTARALAEEHAFITHLAAGGLGVPEVLTTPDGSGAVEQAEWTYEVHRRAPGRDLYRERQSWTPFLTPGHAREAGAALARLHRAAQGFAAPARGVHPLVSSFTIMPSRDPLAAAEAYVADRPGLAAFLEERPWRQDLARLFVAWSGGLAERLEREPLLWTHNDWHPSNLLWSADDRVQTVFDFGLATQTCALHDLATAIERTAIPWLDLQAGGGPPCGRTRVDPAAALALLEGYHAILPLTAADIDLAVRLLPLVHLEFALSEIHYFAGILNDRAQADAAWDDYVMGHADWFHCPSGHAFLRDIAGGGAA